jgi:hypothetical protein
MTSPSSIACVCNSSCYYQQLHFQTELAIDNHNLEMEILHWNGCRKFDKNNQHLILSFETPLKLVKQLGMVQFTS